ncbi:MAG: TolC family protein [Candidatus Marinimicrobia bacterium]|nr:TolC family protein [Candidatus Neomarinimicrobiota bacterium]
MFKKKAHLLVLTILSFPILTFGQSNQSLSLEDCIDLGLKHNQSLAINRYETDRSVSQAKSNISVILPTVNYSLSGSSSETGGLGWNGHFSQSLSISQNIWDGGRWWNTLTSAKVAQDLAEIQLTSYELSTIYQVKVAFYNFLSTLKLLDVYHENLTSSDYQHQLTLERFKLGAASQNDTLRTRVNIEQSRLQIINGEADLQSRSRDLNIILGREWDSPLSLREPAWQAVEVPSISSIIDEALTSNPQLKLLDRNKTVSAYNVKIAKAGYIPSLGLNASYNNSALALGEILGENTASLSTGLSLSWNLFNGTRTKRTVEQSKISAKIARENFDLTKRNLQKDLAQALERMETLKTSIEISQFIQSASEQDLLLAQEQYKIGSLSILDVLRITASFEDAKSNLIRTQYNLKIAEAGLHQLMGIQ